MSNFSRTQIVRKHVAASKSAAAARHRVAGIMSPWGDAVHENGGA